MKIPLEIEDDRLLLHSNVFIASEFIKMQFIVDTGARESFFGTSDTMRIRERFRLIIGYKEAYTPIIIGGGKLALFDIKNVAFQFKTLRGDTSMVLPSFKAAVRMGRTTTPEIPSIIGLRFLREHKLTLVVKPHRELAYLEANNIKRGLITDVQEGTNLKEVIK